MPPFMNWDDARRIKRVVEAAESQLLSQQHQAQGGSPYGGHQSLFKVRVTDEPKTTSAQEVDYWPAWVLVNDPQCGEWIDHYQCWFVEPNQREVEAGIYLAQETGSYLGVPAFVRDVPAASTGGAAGACEPWCNCTVSGGVLTLQDQEEVPSVAVLGDGLYKVTFEDDWITAESFTWSYSCVGTTMFEVTRDRSSVTVQTTNLGHPPRWGIHAIGHCGPADSGSGASGSGAGSGGSGSGSGGGYGPGGSSDCAGAAGGGGMDFGTTYGPFSISSSGNQWYKFSTVINQPYHVTLTRIGSLPFGASISATVKKGGDCDSLADWFACGVDWTTEQACQANVTAAVTGFGFIQVGVSPTSGDYTIMVDEGACP